MWIWIGLLLAAFLIALPFILERLRRPMDEKARRNAPGRFADLTQGKTHYRWHGHVDGPVLVLVHGLTTPSYGRGYSDRAGGRQDCDFFLMQLEDLLIDQGIGEDFSLLGYSMGGAIATCFAARHPDSIDRLILLAPTGLSYRPGRFARFVAQTPLIGDWLMRVFGGFVIRRGILKEACLPSGGSAMR